MLQSTGLQKVGYNLATEQQQQPDSEILFRALKKKGRELTHHEKTQRKLK